MRRSSRFWFIAAVVFWSWVFVSNYRHATAAFITAAAIGIAVAGVLLIFYTIRSRSDH
jgi:hypothetical protein